MLNSVKLVENIDNNVDLIISIDKGKRQSEIVEIAKAFDWKYGEKIIRVFSERQGLKKHIIQCGDLTEKYDLVILDEFGYISSDKEGGELLFTNLSIRTGRKSTIITTNLSFDRWGEVFTDPVMAAAMTDRITYKSYMVDMNGESYRMKETKKWLKES